MTNTVSSSVNEGAAYDADGRLTSITSQNGAFTVNYTYDSRDRLTQVSDTLTGTQIIFNYDDAGRLTGITRPNGVNGTYTYDAAGRLTRIQEGSIIDVQYTVDAAGQVVAANFTAPLDPATLLAPALSTFAYDAAHQIKNSGYAFDARGRQAASPGHSYQWDGASRLVGIDGVTLAYNGANDIETRTAGGVTTRYFYNHALGLTPIVAERNENTLQVQRYYVWTPGGRLLYLIDATSGNAVRFFHYDRVGSTLALTSGAGAVTDAYAYSPYGVLLGHTGTSPQPFTYIGEFGVRSEAAANLYHMRARYYEPVGARFLTRDSRWPRLANNRTLDPYTYANENPLSFIDPLGQDSLHYSTNFKIKRDADAEDWIDLHKIAWLLAARGDEPDFGTLNEWANEEEEDMNHNYDARQAQAPSQQGGFDPVPPSVAPTVPSDEPKLGDDDYRVSWENEPDAAVATVAVGKSDSVVGDWKGNGVPDIVAPQTLYFVGGNYRGSFAHFPTPQSLKIKYLTSQTMPASGNSYPGDPFGSANQPGIATLHWYGSPTTTPDPHPSLRTTNIRANSP